MEAELNQCQIETCKAITQNVVAEGLEQELVTAEEEEEAATTEKNENTNGSDGEVVRSGEQKTDNEGDIHSEENQISSIINNKEETSTQSTEKHEEETACVQPTEADIVDDTKEEQQSAKSSTAEDELTDCGAQANSPIKTDTKRASDKCRERSTDLARSTTMPKSYGRTTKKDIAEKFGGVATSGVRVKRSTSSGANAVKNMLLEWCRAKTRGREGVDIQNFSSSWSNGLAFCALIVAFFPDAFDYDSLDPKNRRQNFQLAFSTAEELADCPPLLDIEDMVRMKVPDSKCVYTYVQELYRSLVAKGLVKTKKA